MKCKQLIDKARNPHLKTLERVSRINVSVANSTVPCNFPFVPIRALFSKTEHFFSAREHTKLGLKLTTRVKNKQ